MLRLSRLAIAFLVIGAVLLAGPIYGFTTVSSERGVDVSTGGDSSAYLGVEPTGEEIEGNGDAATVVYLHNNVGTEFTNPDIVVDGLGNDLEVESSPDTLGPEESGEIVVECVDGIGGHDGNTVQVDVFVEEAESEAMTVSNIALEFDLEYNCHPGGGGGPGGGGPPG
ncbi:hypothetical protein SAMN04487967_1209 [Natronorubrum sediminis]|uniref:Uncharacterized protein n=1 Tax=Natronorubrum sediminis TaxID=640943 RepID=A0A1H6FTS3_9EURY|nr:hypothetical protein [Natronorubrum sediminis]SEH13195.1 hypothetical protein SAMN04487967_1209 [Natronorubrum sediminis]